MTMTTGFICVACLSVMANIQTPTPTEIVETIVEAIETPSEVLETPTESVLIAEPVQNQVVLTENNLKKGEETTMLNFLEPHFKSKIAGALKNFNEKTAKNESYVFMTNMDFRDSYITITTIPTQDEKEKVNAFTYTFPVNKIIDGEKKVVEKMSVIFVIEDGEFKVVDTFTEDF